MSRDRRPPNFLFIMADQLAAPVLPFHGHPQVRAPHMSRLAREGVVFDAAYCNSPICAPSRFSLMSGRLPTAIGAFDNAAEFAASVPTLAHYLVAGGYRTILAGKMHFIGPDQLHGFEERLVTDIYPSDFAWTPNWLAGPADKPSGISMRNVVQAGTCVRSLQMDYDDEVEFCATRRLHDLAREPDAPPFFLVASFSHPHPPYTIDEEHWSRHDHAAIAMPRVPPIPVEQRDIQSQWLHVSHGANEVTLTDGHVRNARHAYYGMVEYVDDKVGRLVATLEALGLRDDTVVVLLSDHGEMLGERGMWYKQTFFEWSSRVPLVFHAPGRFAPRRVASVVSLVDLLPTLTALASATPPAWADPIDGRSFAGLLAGGPEEPDRFAIGEYTDMGVCAPSRMIRRGPFKYIHTHGHPAQLFNLGEDPDELRNRAGDPSHRDTEAALRDALLGGWDGDAVMRDVLASQRRRLFLKSVTAKSGRYPDWSHQARQDDTRRFVRASGAAGAKARARFPFVPPDWDPERS